MMRVQFGKWLLISATLCGAQVHAQDEKVLPQETVVVAQGDIKVTLADVDAWMQEVTEDKRIGFIQSPERIETMLTQLLLMKQLLREASTSGVAKEPLVAAHARLAAERVVARYQLDRHAKQLVVPNMDVLSQERYQSESEKFRLPDVADFSHILIKVDTRGETEGRALIDKIHKEVVRKPQNFAVIAREKSEDPSAAGNAGTINNAKLDGLVPEFADALRHLKVGEISEPVKSDFGWHVIRLNKFTRGVLPPYDEVKTKLIAEMENEFRQRSIRAYTDDLRQREMQPNVPVLERLAYRYGFTGGEPTGSNAGDAEADAAVAPAKSIPEAAPAAPAVKNK